MRTQAFIILSVLAELSVSSLSCGAQFMGKCICGQQLYENQMRYVVNCTDTGLKNTSILEYMPSQTEVLIFTGNFIEELPWNVFGSINDYQMLTIIDMSNNHIREIRGKSYHHVPNVQRLILNHNNLSIARNDDEFNHHHPRVFSNFVNLIELHLTNAFAENTSEALSQNLHDIFVNSNLTKINKLHLEQNEIKSFKDRNVFCDLPSLRDLHLGDNYLNEINFNILCLKKLRFLDLERNKFENVKQKDLNLFTNLEHYNDRTVNLVVDFMLNPFVCNCQLKPFIDWMHVTNVTVRNRENYLCHRAASHTMEAVLSFDIGTCKINSQIVKTTMAHTVTLAMLLVLLSALLISLISAAIYINKDRIKHAIYPILDTVSKKVQYTTIKDDDCQEIHV